MTRLQVSEEYRAARDELREAEAALIEQGERVAALRRALPLDTVMEDHVFIEGPPDVTAGDAPTREVRLSELFTAPDRALVIYHFMFGKAQEEACPMCTMWIDGLNGVAGHLARTVDVAVAAAADPGVLREHARARGWTGLRLLSCGENTFKADLGSEDGEGVQKAAASTFTLADDGSVRHFTTAFAYSDPPIEFRGLDLLSPPWQVLDLTPAGRGEWYPSLGYAPAGRPGGPS